MFGTVYAKVLSVIIVVYVFFADLLVHTADQRQKL